jgi:predicted dehydrogenase
MAASTSQVGVAVVGFGYWGANLARNVAASHATSLVGIVEPDERNRERAAHAHPGVSTWARLADALDDDEVAAVVLATPVHTHHVLSLQVLNTGRHVLVEKPLATSVAEARELVDAADHAGLVLMVGHTFLYASPVQHLKSLVEKGTLGTVNYLSSARLSLGRIRTDCDALWNFAPHDVAIISHLLGAQPVEVSATGFSFIQSDIDDVCFATMRFPDGQGAGLQVSWIDPRKTRLLTVVGDEKMAIYDDVSPDQKVQIVDAGVAHDQTLGEYRSMGEFQVRTRAGDILIPHLEYGEPLLQEVNAFGAACMGGPRPPSDGQHGLGVVAVLEAMSTSKRRGGAPVAVEL